MLFVPARDPKKARATPLDVAALAWTHVIRGEVGMVQYTRKARVSEGACETRCAPYARFMLFVSLERAACTYVFSMLPVGTGATIDRRCIRRAERGEASVAT